MLSIILVLFINGQELHLADMSATDCWAAMTSIQNAGGDAACIPDNDPRLGSPN